MLIDSTSPECALGNIFLMDGASHFVIIFARVTARNGAKLSAAIETKLESAAVDLFPQQDAKFIIRARSLPPDYFLIARRDRAGGGISRIPLHPLRSRTRLKARLCVHFFQRHRKVEKPLGIF